MKNKIIVLLFSLVLFGCNNVTQGVIDTIPDKVIKINVKDAIVEDFTKIIKVESVIPLKVPENSPIGTIDKILFADNKIIILDKLTESIIFFDRTGNFLSKIAKKGRGPGEYSSISNMSVTLPDTLNIVDIQLQRIRKYTFNGKHILSRKIEGWPEDYIEKNSYQYLSIYSSYLSKNENSYYLNVRSKNKKKTGYLPFLSENIVSMYIRPTIFFTNSKDLFYHHHYDDNIYRLDNEKLHIAYKIDFGEFAYPTEKLLKAKDYDQFKGILKKQKYVGNISDVNITSSYLYFGYEDGNGGFNNYVENLKTGKNIHYSGLKNNDIAIPITPISNDGEFFYSLLNPWELPKSFLEKFNVKYHLGLTPESNSVLVKYNYK